MPFLMEETCCYHPGRGWEETMQRLTHGYLHSIPSVCRPAPQNDEIMHTVMNSRKKNKACGVRWVHLKPDGCPILSFQEAQVTVGLSA